MKTNRNILRYNHTNNDFDKDMLFKNIKESETLFREEVMDYLYSMYNLEASILHEGNISSDIIDKLYNHEFYNQLVAYNIFNRSFKLLNSNKNIKEYIIRYPYVMKVNFTEKELNCMLFELTTNYRRSDLSFYSPTVYSAGELKEINEFRIKSIESQLENHKSFSSSYYDEYNNPIFIGGPSYVVKEQSEVVKERLKEKLKVLKSYTDDTFEKDSEFYMASSDLKEEVLNLLLSDFGLNLDKDFSYQHVWSPTEERHKIKEYKNTTIHYL